MKIFALLLIAALFGIVVAQNSFVGFCRFTGTVNDPNINGTAYFRSVDGVSVEVEINIAGITQNPNSEHGIHVHTYGDITTNNGAAAGVHYNPNNAVHGCETSATREVGDMGNWNAVNGVISQTKTLDLLTLTGGQSIIGRGVIFHNGTDNCVNMTSSGARNGQCVIGIANPANAAAKITGANQAKNQNTAVQYGVCNLVGTNSTNNVNGIISFTVSGDNVLVRASISGLAAGTGHGIHIHQFGDLSSAANIGGHFDPLNTGVHAIPGLLPAAQHHVGDLGTVCSYDSNGIAYYASDNNIASLANGTRNIIGRSISLHAIPDSNTTVYGDRIGFCVIGIAASDKVAAFPAGINVQSPVCSFDNAATSTASATASTSATSTGSTSTASVSSTASASTSTGRTSSASFVAVSFVGMIFALIATLL